MKNVRKILALLFAVILVVTMAYSAFAASITINRDESYASDSSGDGNEYKYYKVFSASYGTTPSGTGGGSTSGTPGDITYSTPAPAVSYYASDAVAAKFLAAGATKGSGTPLTYTNDYFKLTQTTASGKWLVEWVNSSTDSATAQAAAQWLYKNDVYEEAAGSGTKMGFNNGKWTTGTIDEGYYLVAGATGNNLVAATTDITITEKNTYPSLDKTQADEDNTKYNDTKRSVAVGDVINYQIKVDIPATVKAGDVITVTDTASTGLTYVDNSFTYDGPSGTSATSATASSGSTWAMKIVITDDNKAALAGQTVTFKFAMTVNDNAVTNDPDKKNSAKLDYGTSGTSYYETKPDVVEYETYYAGIEKYDGQDSGTKLPGVKFTLTEKATSGTEIDSYVVLVGNSGSGLYRASTSGTTGSTTTVVTNASGTIVILGLDGADKTYYLTEIETNDGYNLLDAPVKLNVKVLDKSGSYDVTKLDPVVNNKGTLLPSTGGIGTTIFYVVGAVLVLGAGVVLITRKRMDKEEN